MAAPPNISRVLSLSLFNIYIYTSHTHIHIHTYISARALSLVSVSSGSTPTFLWVIFLSLSSFSFFFYIFFSISFFSERINLQKSAKSFMFLLVIVSLWVSFACSNFLLCVKNLLKISRYKILINCHTFSGSWHFFVFHFFNFFSLIYLT